jgi:hypothetical protein
MDLLAGIENIIFLGCPETISAPSDKRFSNYGHFLQPKRGNFTVFSGPNRNSKHFLGNYSQDIKKKNFIRCQKNCSPNGKVVIKLWPF